MQLYKTPHCPSRVGEWSEQSFSLLLLHLCPVVQLSLFYICYVFGEMDRKNRSMLASIIKQQIKKLLYQFIVNISTGRTVCLFFFFCRAWDQTQSHVHARQVLYHWATFPAPRTYLSNDQTNQVNLNGVTHKFSYVHLIFLHLIMTGIK
jgi:hypothetical protein